MRASSVPVRPAVLLMFLALTAAWASPPATPKREVRAVWLTTAAGLDWPHSLDPREQQASLRHIVASLRSAGFNTIFFQARARGDAYYRSTLEPWAENLTGTLGKDPGWDPLAFLIAEAHATGMEVHAWLNVYKVRGGALPPASVPPHPARAHPEWVVMHAGEGWLDPGLPDVRAWLVNVVVALARTYEIDGVNFDYCRYPGRDFADGESYRRFGAGAARDRWRKENVDRFVTECYDRLSAVRPLLKVGASPLGVYGENGDSALGALREYYQDARLWLRTGKLDYVAPQIYWNIGETPGDPDFSRLFQGWVRASAGRHVYAGIGAYKRDVAREIPEEIDAARSAGGNGQSFFRYESIKNSGAFGGRYATSALIPPMTWKGAIAPLAPLHIGVTEIATNVFQIEWVPSPSGDHASRYVIYRSPSRTIPSNDPRAIAGLTRGNETVYVDTVRSPESPTAYYAVSALDPVNNESSLSPVSGETAKGFIALRGKLTDATGLSASLSSRGGTPRLVAYSLARRSTVDLSIIMQNPGRADSLVASLARGVMDRGLYVVGVREIPYGPGKYVVRLTAGDTTLEQSIELTR